MTKNTQQFHNNQPRTDMFLRGEFGPRRRPWPSKTWPPCFKYKPSPTMPSSEPLKGFKYNPWPSVSTLAMFEPFFQIQPASHGLVCRFLRQTWPDTTQRSSRQCWENGLCQKRQCLCGHTCEETEETTLCFYAVNKLSLTHFYRDAFSILISFFHSVHLCISLSKNITSTEIFVAETNTQWTLCINSVFQFLLLISWNVYWYVCVIHVFYMYLNFSQVIPDCQVFSTKIRLLSVLVCDNCFHLIDFI